MAKYKLLIDESGTFYNEERYLIFGGVYFRLDDQQILEDEFVPLHKLICKSLNIKELHGSENKEIFNYICAPLGANNKIFPFVFVIDKERSFIFDKYNKKSFKYNKAIEWLIRRMIINSLFDETNDEIFITIDDINLNHEEKENLYNYLPSTLPCIKNVISEDSRKIICLQFADVIANHFSKKRKCNINDPKIKLLNPKIFCFLEETEKEYFISK